MKKLLLLFSLTTIHYSLTYAQNWVWAKQVKPVHLNMSEADVASDHGLITDKTSVNLIQTGEVQDSVWFGTYKIGNKYNPGIIYLCKYDSNGNVLWAAQPDSCPDGNGSTGNGVGVDNANNIYVAGSFSQDCYFPGTHLYSPNINGSNAFLVKYGPGGNFKWARQNTGSAFYSTANSIAVDGNGNAYITGSFSDTAIFGTFKLKGGGTFLVKYDSNGNVLWAKQSYKGNSSGNSVAIDGSGNAYITGYFGDTVIFGTDTLRWSYNNPYNQLFIAKYNSSGSFLWAKQSTGPSAYCTALGNSVATDIWGFAYLVGYFTDTVSLGSYQLKTNIPNYTRGIFIAKYNPSGSLDWIKQGITLDSNDFWTATSVAASTQLASGGCFAASSPVGYRCSIKFGATTYTLNSNSLPTLYMQFDSAGNFPCGKIFAEGTEEDGDAVAIGRFEYDRYYLSGDLADPEVIGPDSLKYGNDMEYIAMWHQCPDIQAVNEVHSNDDMVTLYPNPNNGVFTIEVKSEELKVKSVVEVYNMLGEKIYSNQFNIQNSKFNIDLSSRPAGIYLYRLTTDKGELIKDGKFVIER